MGKCPTYHLIDTLHGWALTYTYSIYKTKKQKKTQHVITWTQFFLVDASLRSFHVLIHYWLEAKNSKRVVPTLLYSMLGSQNQGTVYQLLKSGYGENYTNIIKINWIQNVHKQIYLCTRSISQVVWTVKRFWINNLI